MTSPRPKSLLGLGLILLLAACTLPGLQAKPSLSPVEQAGTIVAMTLQGGGVSTLAAAAATSTSTPLPPSPTATTKPTLYVNTNDAKCRSGPGTDFKEIASFNAGTTVDMIAKDTADGYWLVKDPASGSSCWVSVQDATPGGSFDLLPELTPPPVAQTVPGRPSRGNWNFSCDNTSLTTLLGWQAPGDNVNGYRVYRQGSKIAELPSSTTSYKETIPFTYGGSMSYAVEAYNDAGAGPQVTWDFHCP